MSAPGKTSTFPNTQPSIGPALPSSVRVTAENEQPKGSTLRTAAGKYWSDKSLDEWPEGDYRIFCGDLGNEVTDDLLAGAFRPYKSFQRARVVRDKRTAKTKGYGFASFARPEDMVLALKQVNGKYVGNRPIRLMKSKWEDRCVGSEKNKRLYTYDNLAESKSKNLKKFKKIKTVKKT